MFVGICLAVTVKRCWDVPEPEDPDSLKILHFKLAKACDELHSLSTEIKRSSTSSERGNAASYTFAVREVQVLQEGGTGFLISSDPTRSVAMHACKHSSILKYANTWQSWLGSEVSQNSLQPMNRVQGDFDTDVTVMKAAMSSLNWQLEKLNKSIDTSIVSFSATQDSDHRDEFRTWKHSQVDLSSVKKHDSTVIKAQDVLRIAKHQLTSSPYSKTDTNLLVKKRENDRDGFHNALEAKKYKEDGHGGIQACRISIRHVSAAQSVRGIIERRISREINTGR